MNIPIQAADNLVFCSSFSVGGLYSCVVIAVFRYVANGLQSAIHHIDALVVLHTTAVERIEYFTCIK